MSNDIKIPIVVIFVMVATKMLLLMIGRNKKEDTEILVLWTLIASAASLTHNFYVLVLLIVIIKIFYLKNDIGKNIVAFFALWSVIPTYFLLDFPLPSIPLMTANYPRVVMIVCIFPILPKLLNQAKLNRRRVFLDVPVLYLAAMEVVIAFSEHENYQITTTQSIRETMELLMDIVIPYFLIVLWADTWEKMKRVLFAFMISGIVLSVFGVLEGVSSWNLFTELDFKEAYPIDGWYEYRAFLRVKTAFPEAISYGVFEVIALGLTFAVMFRTKQKMLVKSFIVFLFLAALYGSQSRGDQVAVVVLMSMYFFFRMQSSSRFLLILFLVLALPVAGYISTQNTPAGPNTELNEVDEYGTFEYRKELFFTELALIPKYPFFGNPLYKLEPSMQKLKQGQGIVDPVNAYLTMAVEQGMIALLFFVYFIIRSIRTGLSYVKYGYAVNNQVWINLGAAIAATVVGVSVAVAFTSFSGTNPSFFWFTMGIARAMQLNLNKRLEGTRDKEEYDLGYS